MSQTPVGGIGSNQYQTRPRAPAVDPRERAAIAAAVQETVVDPGVRGLPRPRNSTGAPVPYLAEDPDELGTIHRGRWNEIASTTTCQVCGEPTEPGNRVAVVTHRPNNDEAPYVDSGGVLHRKCYDMARKHCPHLKETAHDLYAVPDEAVILLDITDPALTAAADNDVDYDTGLRVDTGAATLIASN